MYSFYNNTKNKQKESGVVLIVCMALLLMLSIIGILSLRTSNTEMDISGNELRSTDAFYAAESGIAIAEQALWDDYINASIPMHNKAAGEKGSMNSYRYFISNLGVYDASEQNLIASHDLSQTSLIKSVSVKRTDKPDATIIKLTSLGGSVDGAEATVIKTIRIGSAPFEGVDYALMANNINCIMCHARIDNADRFYNTADSLRGSFDRVKVASLESMLLRTGSADSRIAGTLYTRGIVTDKSGVPITDLSQGGSCVTGYQLDGTSGNILEPLNQVSLTNATGSPLPENGNLYLNYPTNEADMTDGILPESFPAAIPDLNGNKIVDDAEFASFLSEASGTISGGIKYGISHGSSYLGGSLPSSGNISNLSNDYNGNVILIGTAANPIEINGTLAIDGDVIIRGVVKGTGQIVARGNVYVAGDVTYADGTNADGSRSFGVAADGTQNALAFTVGGNIIVSDYLTPKGGNIFDVTSMDPGDGSWPDMSFTMSEITLFNRMEWTRTQQFLPDVNSNLVPNSMYVSGYQPRYYTLGPGDPIYIYNKSDGSGGGTYWDPVSSSWQGKEHLSSYDMTYLTAFNPGDLAYTNSAKVNLAPQNNWVTETQLKQFWNNDETSRTAGEPYQLDGLYYTNNAFFALIRSDKYNSKTWGQMVANGSWVAADMGVLVPGSKNYASAAVGLKLNYDFRLKEWVNLPDYAKVELYSIGWTSK